MTMAERIHEHDHDDFDEDFDPAADVDPWAESDPEDDQDYDGDQLDLAARHSLRRVAGMSTQLADISEVEYRDLQLERVVLVSVWTSGTEQDAENAMVELKLLAETAGSEVLEGLVQRRQKPDPATYIGRGKVDEVREVVIATGADTVICDGELTPGQLTALGTDTVRGLRVLRGIGGEDEFLRRYVRQSQTVRTAGARVAIPQAALAASNVLLPGVFMVSVTAIALREASAGRLQPGDLVAFFGYSAFLMTPIRTASPPRATRSSARSCARRWRAA